MSKFVTTLKTDQIDRTIRQLTADLVYDDDVEGMIVVPKDFVTDFASIGGLHNVVLFPLFALFAGYGNYASTVHDYLYRNGKLTRARADAVFYRALRAEGIANWRACGFWVGVRIGGASSYKD
jgi:hypothetical protein